MSGSPMDASNRAQIDLIRRYARTLRQFQSDAAQARGRRSALRDRRFVRQESGPLVTQDRPQAADGPDPGAASTLAS
jgi:hypothetical protein